MASLTPMTMLTSASPAGAEMMTLPAPALRCAAAASRLVKRPVDSMTTSAPRALPGQVRRIGLAEDLDGLAVDDQGVVFELHVARPHAVHRVVLEEVAHRGAVHEVVDPHDLDVGAALERRPQIQTADAAEPVDSNLGTHLDLPIGCCTAYQSLDRAAAAILRRGQRATRESEHGAPVSSARKARGRALA